MHVRTHPPHHVNALFNNVTASNCEARIIKVGIAKSSLRLLPALFEAGKGSIAWSSHVRERRIDEGQ